MPLPTRRLGGIRTPRQYAAALPASNAAVHPPYYGGGYGGYGGGYGGYGGGYGGYGGGYGGWGSQWHTAAEGRMRPGYMTEAHPGLAATADDVIKRQGGLSPSYGPSGINDTYSRTPTAFDRLQQQRRLADEGGDASGADRLAKTQQAVGAGFSNIGQQVMDQQNERFAIGRAGAAPSTQEAQDVFGGTGQGIAADQAAGVGSGITQTDPFLNPSGPSSMSVPAQDQGGDEDELATAGEEGPETKFNDDGTIEQITKPILMKNPKPGVIVPNGDLRKFLQRFRHPAKDVSTVSMTEKGPVLESIQPRKKAKAFDNGGTTGLTPAWQPIGHPLGGPTMLGGPGFGKDLSQPIKFNGGAYDKGGKLKGLEKFKAKAFDASGQIGGVDPWSFVRTDADIGTSKGNVWAPPIGSQKWETGDLQPSTDQEQERAQAAPTDEEDPFMHPSGGGGVQFVNNTPPIVPQRTSRDQYHPRYSWEDPAYLNRWKAAAEAAQRTIAEQRENDKGWSPLYGGRSALEEINQAPTMPLTEGMNPYGTGHAGGTAHLIGGQPARATLDQMEADQDEAAGAYARDAARAKERTATKDLTDWRQKNPRMAGAFRKWQNKIRAFRRGGMISGPEELMQGRIEKRSGLKGSKVMQPDDPELAEDEEEESDTMEPRNKAPIWPKGTRERGLR